MVALWDADGSELEDEAESLNISLYSCYEDDVLLNKDIGLLIILCPPIHHAQLAVKALGIAKHVYVHPPCSTQTSQTLRMVQSAAYYPNLCAFVGSLRCLPAVAEMKQRIQQGYLGRRIAHCDVRLNSTPLIGSNSRYSWRCSEDMGGGVLNFFGSQIIDLVLYLLGGQRAVRVSAVFRTVQRTTPLITGIRHITADDVASLVLETDSNCLVTINLNSHSCSFSQEVTFTGDVGQLVLRHANLFGRRNLQDAEEEILYLDNSNQKNSMQASHVEDEECPQLYLQGYAHMFDQLRLALSEDRDGELGRSSLATFEDALHVSEVIWAARQSFIEKNWQRVDNSISGINGGAEK